MVKHSKKRNMQFGRGKTKTKKRTLSSLYDLELDDKNKPVKSYFIPDYKINSNSGEDTLILKLKKGQTIINNHGAMAWMDNDIHVETTSRGGILKGMFRSAFTSVSMFMTRYTGVRDGNKICNSSFLPGMVLPIVLRPGKNIVISPDSLICFTDNLKLDSVSKIGGLMVTEGMRKTRFTNESNTPGMVWLNSYGGCSKKILKKGDELLVDNGLFLASDGNVDYSLKKIGNIKSSLLSGEGFTMKFRGPCYLLLQKRDHYSLIKHINSFVKTNNNSSSNFSSNFSFI